MWIYAVSLYLLAGLGVNLGYHRLLSHRSLRVRKWLERTLVLVGLPAGTPVQWAGNHRFHHAHADDPEDPHSPIQRGFWYAHTGWYISSDSVALSVGYALLGPMRLLLDAWMRPRTNQQFNHLSADVAQDPWYRALSRPGHYSAAMLLHFAIGAGVPVALWGGAGFALAWATYTVLYNLGDSVDSVAHLVGSRLPRRSDMGQAFLPAGGFPAGALPGYVNGARRAGARQAGMPTPQGSSARNNYVLGVLLLGEGWHANHHWDPRCARHGWFRRQFDWTWQVIRMLRAAGLADQVRSEFRAVEKG
jgi:fatty-acid desaturase